MSVERDEKGNVKPEVGQIWQDKDWRSPGRFIRVDQMIPARTTPGGLSTEWKAKCTVVASQKSPSTVGRTFTMLVRRMKPNSTGYVFVAETESAWKR